MEVSQDPQGHTPPGTLFDDGYTITTNRGVPTLDPEAGVYAENFYAPLFTESQATNHADHTTAITEMAPEAHPTAEAAAASA